ncbi:MAG: helix-turn-helix domain-containing protein [Halanaeroarchaeum sp.]
MTVLATVEVPTEEFVLDDVIGADPRIVLELEPVVPLGRTCAPHLRLVGASVPTLKSALEADPDVAGFSIIDASDDGAIARIEWDQAVGGLFEVVDETGGAIMTATARGSTWRLRLRFGSHDALSTCYHRCVERGISLHLEGVQNGAGQVDLDRNGALTPAQSETLRVALEQGYFEVPRGITLETLAKELSVSDTAVSQRLRRGLSTVVADQLRSTGDGIDRPDGLAEDGIPGRE